LARQLYTARLEQKLLLSDPMKCFHLEFSIEELHEFPFVAGQFISGVAPDATGKVQTRAYSIASASRANRFDLCVNRVEGGFFSNYLCDLEPGDTMQFHGPHGLFTLRAPLTDGIMIATGTGIAPMRGFVEHLFPENAPDRTEGRHFWLVYGTRHATELYYRHYFEKVAAEHPNFHYAVTLSRPHEGWEGQRGYVQELVAQIATEHAAKHKHSEPTAPTAPDGFNIHAYICGLNEMVSANRDRLKELGWERKQIIFERYD
jgi:ferredoxin-NADP reductase